MYFTCNYHIILWFLLTHSVLFCLFPFPFLAFFWNYFLLFHCLFCWFRNNILLFITLMNSLEITMCVSNLLKFTLVRVFFFLLPPKYKDIRKYNSKWDRNMFLASSAMGAYLILSPSYCLFGSSRIFYQFHVMAMHPLCYSHAFPKRPQ